MVTRHFDEPQSMHYRFGEDQSQVLKVLAERYIGANAQADFVYRAFQRSGILQNAEGLYEFDFGKRFPEATKGDYVWAAGLVWGDEQRNLDLLARCQGPVRLYFNGELIYRSTVIDELAQHAEVKLPIDIQPGWNTMLLECRYTPAGFGCQLGADEGKVRILNVLAPFGEREGQAGWVYSPLLHRDTTSKGLGLAAQASPASVSGNIIASNTNVAGSTNTTGEQLTMATASAGHASAQQSHTERPDRIEQLHAALLGSEQQSGLTWLPAPAWSSDQQTLPSLERMYGKLAGHSAYAWTRIQQEDTQQSTIRLSGHSQGPLRIWLQQQLVVSLTEAGNYNVDVEADFGPNDLLVYSECTADGAAWDYSVQATCGERMLAQELPWRIRGAYDQSWMYAGPFPKGNAPDPADMYTMNRLYPTEASASSSAPNQSSSGQASAPPTAHTYWRLDRPETWIRPYYENAMLSNKWTVGQVTNYGRWDYPLGVTVYGLLKTGRYLQRPDITQYAAEHVQACTTMYRYSLWDREQYGFPSINQQLVMLKMLDNCGSFGSAMLEAYEECHEPTFLEIADRIADFMLNRLERQPDGAFYRTCEGEYAANTMWADDLYMSTPFLVRYARIRNHPAALDEAARQFLLFRNYLFIPEYQIMSHVYDFKYGQATQIPWGRGNGWTLFSLSEVLEALPEQHEHRAALVDFFNELCEGYATLQSNSGLWHQVLNEPGTYEEASCTAMFAYGFARGVRMGWLRQPDRYAAAARKAWNALTRLAIDRQGNVHGVCSGSRYAFTAEYYDQDLRTVTNDNHGIGIMMLAGTEVARMKQHLGQKIAVSDGVLS
ncbi:glycoside hydrolase family 88 protein [Paenibacillus hunanensis]|uniref:glycoside hydrolase family 88/105 protein n=1 Tax=Paenibacillus hunanensis TaxID=539262 RepID=UPI002A6AE4F0|nr:glycoside hydrolase family 88 protein [Paenibacillus hunanensis]WPP42403.1 glycoside hydrolase family 88 protein [Paenibacillus hunanensis]